MMHRSYINYVGYGTDLLVVPKSESRVGLTGQIAKIGQSLKLAQDADEV